jgi:carboxymethylenebutenolidase
MCDELTVADNAAFSRRDFGAAAGAATIMAMLPQCANAMAVTEGDVVITTPDGQADAYFVHPAKGKHPAVLIWPDIMGLRPAFRQMAKRLAENGYAVLCINPYYRQAKSPVIAPGEGFQDPPVRAKLMPLAMALNATTNVIDAKAFVAFLDAQPSVDRKRKIGTTGYCMGGPMVLRTAAALPARIGAAASFHGGGLATDKPDSPHLLIPKMKAKFLIAVAENDDAREPKAKDTLRTAFAAAKLPAEIEVYAGAQHGWCPPDSKVYNAAQAERAWSRLLALLAKAV